MNSFYFTLWDFINTFLYTVVEKLNILLTAVAQVTATLSNSKGMQYKDIVMPNSFYFPTDPPLPTNGEGWTLNHHHFFFHMTTVPFHCWFSAGIHLLKQNQPKIKTTIDTQPFDAIGPIAFEISKEAWLLCFDEFQVGSTLFTLALKCFSLCAWYWAWVLFSSLT